MRGVDAKSRLLEAHRPRWSGTLTWLAFLAAFWLLEGLLLVTYWYGPGWLLVPLLLVAAHLMHAHLIAFHEAAHGCLCPNRLGNDAAGLFLGTFSLMSLTLYRAAHHTHHAYLATERDEELWPFVLPGTPRWARRLAAGLELTLGLVYTPLLFLRTFLRRGTPIRQSALRCRIWVELALVAGLWGGVTAVALWRGFWLPLAVVFLVPAFLAANLQSLRKYIEHMGLSGTAPLEATRSIRPAGPVGRLLAGSLFNEPYHGVHHTYARLPYDRLPEFDAVLPPTSEEGPTFASYLHALRPTLRGLADPRIGPRWTSPTPPTR